MLKKFFMNTLTSFVGTWIALALFSLVAVLVCVGIVAKLGVNTDSPESVSKGSVLVIDLQGAIEERETALDLDYLMLLQGDIKRPQTLSSLQAAVAEAKTNKNISAIYLKCNGVQAAPATLNALRSSLCDFKESGKKVIAYGGTMMNGDYYVASSADTIMLNPAGSVMLQGIGGTSLYFKNLLDKLGISVQVVKVGTFKSAVEPYILDEMSEPARVQLDTLYGGIWDVIKENISNSRKNLSPEKIDSLVNGLIFTRPASIDKKAGLVDRLVYERCVDSIVAKMVGTTEKKLNYVSVDALLKQTDWGDPYEAKNRIAVLYACGEIVDGGGNGTIDYQSLVPQIVKLADDDKVKGMVLRVNSPGGAVYGSDQIGEALDYFQSKGKPLAVSMGDYAASGGYWISCCADRIFADPLTITGSIGIFGLIPNVEGLAEKIGVTPQMVATNPEAEFPAIYKPMTQNQQAAMQKFVEDGYDRFVARVSKGRKMPESKVRVIGEGRVWGAGKAVEIGLVDTLGSLNDAVRWIADKTKLGENYNVAKYPVIEERIWDLIPQLSGMKAHEALQRVLTGNYDELAVKFITNVLRQKPLQARMPYFKVEFVRALPMN